MVPLHEEFGWSTTVMSLAVSINLLLYGLTAPFAAALMDRFGIRQVVASALTLVALGAGGSILMTASWQLLLFWGVLIGLGTGSMALVFAATIANRWFVQRRGLVMGILTAGSATGQLIFLPPRRRACRKRRLAGRLPARRRGRTSRGAGRLAGAARSSGGPWCSPPRR